MLMSLGMFVFSLPTLAHDELQRRMDWRHARKPKRLGRVYASEGAARAAATAEKARAARQPRKLLFDLALGRPEICPEQRVTAQGFKADIDAIAWLVAEVTHTLGDRGLLTSVQLETVG